MEAFLGSIVLFAGNFAPRGWALCQGQLLSIAQNTPLFALLGTTYGGDGKTTFALPDLRGRAPIGQGQGPGLSSVDLGEQLGSESITLTTSQMPAHSHLVACDGSNSGQLSPVGNLPGTPGVTSELQLYGSTPTGYMNPMMISAAGGSQPVSVQQPSLGVNYIICLEGLFPSRN